MTTDDKLKIKKAILKAGQMLLHEQKASTKTSKQGDFDFGVVQDKQCEDILLKSLNSLSIRPTIISEESDIVQLGDTDFTIYVDPLDGSINYSRGLHDYAISIAIFNGEKPYIAFVYLPAIDELYYTEVDSGIELNNKKLDTPTADLKNTIVNFEWVGATDYVEIVEQLKSNKILIRTVGSSVISVINVIRGKTDCAILSQNKSWDVATGLIFAQCLGLIATDFKGNDVALTANEVNMILATEPVHKRILPLLPSS